MCCCLLNVANQQRDKKKKQGDQHHEERLSEVDQGMNYQPLMQYSDDQSRRWKEREMSAMVSALKHVVAGDIDVVASQPQQIQQHDNMNAITNVTSTAANSDSSSSYGITSGQKRAREMEGGDNFSSRPEREVDELSHVTAGSVFVVTGKPLNRRHILY